MFETEKAIPGADIYRMQSLFFEVTLTFCQQDYEGSNTYIVDLIITQFLIIYYLPNNYECRRNCIF